MSVDSLNQLLGFGTFALQIITAALFVAYALRKKVPACMDVINQIGGIAFPLAFVVSLLSAGMTLYYSDVLGFEPCALCWWQRIFLYPQVILFGMAMWQRNYSVRCSSIVLSTCGFAFALYHHALQMLPAGALPCPSQGVSCSKITFVEFGYITFPLMAATLFAFLIVLMLAHRSASRN